MRFLAYLLSAICAFGLSIALDQLNIADNIFSALAVIALLGFAATLVHEAGHAWMAARLGAQVLRIVVMPFEYDLVRRRFGWATRHPSMEVGGYVLYRFDTDDTSRRETALIAGAGPAASVALAAVLLPLALLWPTPGAGNRAPPPSIVSVQDAARTGAAPVRPPLSSLPDEAETRRIMQELVAQQQHMRAYALARGLALLLAVVSLCAGLINLLPFRGSDGYILRDALFRR